MSGWTSAGYRDSITETEVRVHPVEVAVRGVVQVTMQRDGRPALTVRMGPDSADRLATQIVDAAWRARELP